MAQRKVMHVLEATLGGTRRYLEDMIYARALDSYECALIYSTLRSDLQFYTLLQELKKRAWKLYEVPMKREVKPFSDIKSLFDVRRAILGFQPDILHCHSSKAGALGRLSTLLISKRYRPAVVYSPHALAIYQGKQYIYIEQILAKATDRFIAISASEISEIVQYCKAPIQNVCTISPFIDCSYYSPISQENARQVLGIAPGVKIITAIGRLSEQKDPLMFLKIYKQLKINHPDLLAIWVGDGNLRSNVEELQAQLGLEGLRITGWVTDVRPFIAASDVVVVPSRYESFGYVTAESQAMERPVVATRVNGSVDIIKDGVTGYLFDAGDISDGITKINNLLSNATRASEMGKNGRDLVYKKFSPDEMCHNLAKAYYQITTS
jgi:glycosyltransferase involved in cell wall biosynthesis